MFLRKTILIGSILAIIFVNNINGQAFEKDRHYVSAGIGVGSYFKTFSKKTLDLAGIEELKISTFWPIMAKYEYAVSDNIGIGLNVAYLHNDISFVKTFNINNTIDTLNVKDSRTSVSVMPRLNIHFLKEEKIDFYWGLGLGLRVNTNHLSFKTLDGNIPNNIPSDYKLSGNFPLGFETTLGLRYYVHPNVAIYGEAGIAKSFLQFGITGKL